jgi:glycosyltransferase involved in cell wall biosynthesis
MRVNFIVEDKGVLKYLGCATAAINLYKELSKNIEIKYNDISTDFDIAHFHTFGPKSIYYLKKFKGISVITAHSTPNLNTGNLAFPSLVNWIYRPLYNNYDHIIAVSKKCQRELEKMGCKPDKSTIYNGIDIKNFIPDSEKGKKFREEIGLKQDNLLILTVAQRTPRKGIFDFLKLAEKFPQYTFLWIGGFPYNLFSKDYKQVAKAIKNHPSNSIFPGFVEDIIQVYSAADVFFMPSYAEGHSIVMLEALSMGLPMIARDVEEYHEAFDDNLLYFSSIDDINNSMFKKEKLDEYSKKTSIIKKYNIDKVAQEHIKLYEQLTS